MEITVLHSQSLFDIAIQHTGNVMNAFAIAVENGLSITAALVPGSLLRIPEEVVIDKDVKDYMLYKGILPASAVVFTDEINIQPFTGVGYWQIENDFIIS